MRRRLLLCVMTLVLAWLMVGSQAAVWAQDPSGDGVAAARQALDQAVEAEKENSTEDAARAVLAAQARFYKAVAARRTVLETRLKELDRIVGERPTRFGVQPNRLPGRLGDEYERLGLELATLALPNASMDASPTFRPEVEPNGAPGQATALILSAPPAAIAYGSIRQADVDYYTFVAPAGARLWAYVDPGGATNPGSTYMDTQLALLAADGVTIIEEDDDDGAGTGGDASIDTTSASVIAGRTLTAGGSYYLRVQTFSAIQTVNPYRLFIHVTPTSTFEVESNNSIGVAQALSPGTSVSASIAPANESDFYSVNAVAGNYLFFAVDADPERDLSGTDIMVDLFDTDGATILMTVNTSSASGSPAPPGEGANFMAVKSGLYYLRVRHTSGSTGSYSIAALALSGVINPFTSKPAVFRTANWLFRTTLTGGATEFQFNYGLNTDVPLMCDWNGDGIRTPGLFRTGSWLLRNNFTAGSPDLTFTFGTTGDVPVCGDWNGDGVETIGVYRSGQWLLRNTNTAGAVNLNFFFGLASDKPVVGDWNAEGVDTIGVYRAGQWLLRNTNTSGSAEISFTFGGAADTPVTGDWDGDGGDSVGFFNAGNWSLRNALSAGAADTTFSFGQAGDVPLTWK